MELSTTTIVSALVAVIALVLFLLIAKRVLRLAGRLLLVGLLVVALLGLGAWGWWNGWFGSSPPQKNSRPSATRGAASR